MANNKMLIDASHPEETRVAVVRGNRIEEFDFESQAKRQLRGNIYLAKVTRVEPSLQAAFVDYGGNRHGFLAFNEIHPDYYQIPTADRQALLDEEAMAAEEDGDSDAAQISADAEASEDENGEDGTKKKRRAKRSQSRGRRGRKSKASADEDTETDASSADGEASASAEDAQSADVQADEALADDSDDAVVEAEPETAETADSADDDATAEVAEENSDTDESGEEDEPKSGSIAAIVETDSISEPAPPDDFPGEEEGEDDGGADAEQREPAAEAAEAEAAEPAKKKPRRRTTRRKPAKAAQEAEADTVADTVEKDAASEEPAEAVADQADTEPSGEEEADAGAEATEGDTESKEKPARARRSTRGRRRSKSDDEENGQEEQDESVESVGSEDALEEVPYRRKLRRQYKIQEVVKRRQVMLVQVVKEERGNKGAALTTYLSLAGRYSVLMPNTARGGGISRKITNANDRKRLKAIAAELDVPAGMGVILRTAGASRTKAEVKRDFEYLMRLWENVRSLTLTSNAPCLVYEEGSLIKRSIRDLYDKNTGEVLVSGDEGYREAKEFMRMLMPSHAKNVKQYEEDQSIFSRNGVEQQLDRLLSPQVTLKSGGYLVINQTEALVSIDVNSGRSTREHSIEDTALATNLEASDEIARQLRLRDLAGLIVIDFIDMEENRNNRSVEKRLKEALKSDRARIQVGRISHFGLMEMSRQRIRASVMESTMEVCPHCLGTGHVRSDSSIALHIFRAIEDHAMRHSRNNVVVRCPTGIAIDILNNKRAGLVEIEQRLGLQVQIIADANLPGQSFTIEKGEQATGSPARVTHVQMDSAPSIETDADDELETVETGAPDESDEDDDGTRKKRRRRRGKRGGRRNRSEEAESVDAAAADAGGEDTGSEEVATAVAADQEAEQPEPGSSEAPSEAENEDSAGNEADEAVAEPSADITTEPESDDSDTGDDTSQQADSQAPQPDEEPAPASPRGRNTRRPRRTANAPAAANDSGDGVSSGDVMVAEAPSEPASEGNEAEDDGSKRSGWWNKGGGFF